MKKYIIKLLGGYADIGECLDDIIQKDTLLPANQLLSESVKHLLNTISRDDIFDRRGVLWYFDNKQLSPQQLATLRNDVRFFENSFLFKVLDVKIKYLSNKKLYEAQNLADILVAKALLYQWDIVKDALKKELASLPE